MREEPLVLYYWPTPNGWKAAIMLEEVGLPYTVQPVDITAGEQFAPEFLRISPNNKIPALVDPAGPQSADGAPFALFESGAILLYLAERTGRLLPREPLGYWQAVQWLMFQVGGIGPMLGQAHHFRNYAPERLDYAVERYTRETSRLYDVLDRQLCRTPYVAGAEYTIADIATWPWIKPHQDQGQDLDDFPNLKRWFEAIGARPAVQRGAELLAEDRERGKSDGRFDDRAREVLFGATQYQRR